ncbi:MAG TPA: GNAT family N-acetyltransferase [Thermoanaerobaculia bacterium]|nr:GNAT family N-acetyltransferase [Thermoanaerobaculia bacterium]
MQQFVEPGVLETDRTVVRSMQAGDLAAIVRIDAASTGRARPHYFDLMLQRALHLAGLQISLVAELEGRVVGFMIGSLHYGEFGVTEPIASIEAIGVELDARKQGVGKALMRQLRLNLGAIGVRAVRTDVDWNDFDLLAFLQREGFAPAPRLCLERKIDPTAPGDT